MILGGPSPSGIIFALCSHENQLTFLLVLEDDNDNGGIVVDDTMERTYTEETMALTFMASCSCNSSEAKGRVLAYKLNVVTMASLARASSAWSSSDSPIGLIGPFVIVIVAEGGAPLSSRARD